MTQEFLQDTMVADLKELFSHERLKNSLGVEREIQIYPRMFRSAGGTMKP